MIEQGIYSLLANDATIKSLVANRIYPVLLPTNVAYPAISYQDISASSGATMDGSGERMKRIQFSIWSKAYADGKAVQAAIRNLLDGYSGTLSDGSVLQNVRADNELDGYEKDLLLFQAVIDFIVYFV